MINNKEKIEKFIKDRGYTWKFDSVIENFIRYRKGYYVSYTMKDIIENNLKELDEIVGNSEDSTSVVL